MSDWNKIKTQLYFLDGSLRDIWIQKTTKLDWQVWIDFVNSEYKIEHLNYDSKEIKATIDYNMVLDFWNGNLDACSMATIFLGKLRINIFFFGEFNIDNDLCPREFNTIEDHNALIDYLSNTSKLLKKPVLLTLENQPESILLKVYDDALTLYNDNIE